MSKQLVFVHGRAQQDKDPDTLKAEWLDALAKGLTKNRLTLPISEADVRFAYYGNTLRDLTSGFAPDQAVEVIVRGFGDSMQEKVFFMSVLNEALDRFGVGEDQVADLVRGDAIERGPLQWQWMKGMLRAIDRYVPFASGIGVALSTADVYDYLTNSVIRDDIDVGVAAAFRNDVQTVVVGHSLGSVIAYNLLRNEGHLRGWTVPMLVTVGSPLAVTAIRNALKQIKPMRQPRCVASWFNAMDAHDVVALYPLTPAKFPITPTPPVIRNKTDVLNDTSNRHGIAGYLCDAEVAMVIHDALVR